jgi:hypothetical protein
LCGISQGRGNLELKLNLAHAMATERDGYVVMLPIFVKGADPAYFHVLPDQHHKDWTIDQMVRKLTADDYDNVITEAKSGEGGPETYEWNTGIAP